MNSIVMLQNTSISGTVAAITRVLIYFFLLYEVCKTFTKILAIDSND